MTALLQLKIVLLAVHVVFPCLCIVLDTSTSEQVLDTFRDCSMQRVFHEIHLLKGMSDLS